MKWFRIKELLLFGSARYVPRTHTILPVVKTIIIGRRLCILRVVDTIFKILPLGSMFLDQRPVQLDLHIDEDNLDSQIIHTVNMIFHAAFSGCLSSAPSDILIKCRVQKQSFH